MDTPITPTNAYAPTHSNGLTMERAALTILAAILLPLGTWAIWSTNKAQQDIAIIAERVEAQNLRSQEMRSAREDDLRRLENRIEAVDRKLDTLISDGLIAPRGSTRRVVP